MQFNAAAARGSLDRPSTLADIDGAAAGIEFHVGTGADHQIAASGRGYNLPSCRTDLNGAATRLHVHVAAYLADPDITAAAGGKDRPANLVQMDGAAVG